MRDKKICERCHIYNERTPEGLEEELTSEGLTRKSRFGSWELYSFCSDSVCPYFLEHFLLIEKT